MIRSLFLLLLFFSLCLAQAETDPQTVGKSTTQSFTLKKITSNGSKRFTETDIVSATGLKPGDTVTAENLKEAANRLMQSGAFAQVGYRFNGDFADYTVTDAAQFVPASF